MSYVPIICVDFDGTLCENKWPGIGTPRLDIIHKLLEVRERLGAKLILWTCRTGEDLDEAIDFCNHYGLKFDAVNDNLQLMKNQFGTDPRKVCCTFYLDDKNIGLGDVPYLDQLILDEIERHS